MKSTHTHTFVHHYFFLCCLLLSPALEHNSSRAGLTFCHHITSSHTDFTVRHILTPPPCVCVSLLLFYFYKLYARGKFSASSAAAFENSFRNNRRFMENCVVFCLLTFLYVCVCKVCVCVCVCLFAMVFEKVLIVSVVCRWRAATKSVPLLILIIIFVFESYMTFERKITTSSSNRSTRESFTNQIYIFSISDNNKQKSPLNKLLFPSQLYLYREWIPNSVLRVAEKEQKRTKNSNFYQKYSAYDKIDILIAL